MSREPTLEEWFATLCVNRQQAKESLSDGHTDFTETYETIVSDADQQMRSLCNRLRKLTIHSIRSKKKEVPDPIEAIKIEMNRRELTRKDLIKYIGSLSKISEVLNRKRSLSLSMIRKLNEGLGIPVEVLVKRTV